MADNYFKILNEIDVNEHTDKKGSLTYLSWSWAWAEVKKKYPDANYTIYENADGWNYHTDGRTCWVKVSVTINGIEHIEMLPVMDFKNKSIPLASITSFEVNKAIQRAITKACARHGLGLYIYSGEDLPEESDGKTAAQMLVNKAEAAGIAEQPKEYKCAECGTPFKATKGNDGKSYSAGQISHIAASHNTDGVARCSACAKKLNLYK